SRCLYAAYGWEYVAKRGPFYIYRTRDPAAREVDTDPHTQALVLRSLHRRARESLLTLVLLFFLVYPLTLNWWEILRTLWQHAPAAFLLYLILFLWITGFSLARARHYRCLCRQLEAGQSLDHGIPWRPRARRYRLVSALHLGLLAACLAVAVWLRLG
ncbi:hypothetical protein, partial [Evtepia gabavorous]